MSFNGEEQLDDIQDVSYEPQAPDEDDMDEQQDTTTGGGIATEEDTAPSAEREKIMIVMDADNGSLYTTLKIGGMYGGKSQCEKLAKCVNELLKKTYQDGDRKWLRPATMSWRISATTRQDYDERVERI